MQTKGVALDMYQSLKCNEAAIELPQNHVHLWLVDQQEVLKNTSLERYSNLLSHDEHQRMSSFKTPLRRQQYVITRVALRTILSLYMPAKSPLDFEFVTNTYGKPRLVNTPSPLFFNLSHSKHKIVLAFTTSGEVGVDIEYLKLERDVNKIANHSFHKHEWCLSQTETQDTRIQQFYKLWALKEAFIKAQGSGHAIPTNSFYFTGLDSHEPCIKFDNPSTYEPKKCRFRHSFIVEQYSLAIALQQAHNPSLMSVFARNYIPFKSMSSFLPLCS
ncbi:4'-phosphopantetheinyl transferase superfamily protein [Alteromonas sp. 5E99-2]|uniref:4'-phosphopantetheinyl transferase family protein n=1 Tax=Alteromonas sp. 5E99-2 TaxID=2817683 RepID=UPI001A98639F|nr:4'-phosphopantetheinyl transferase superfamily protein [Alteromonas sp. 5E99-2]MBO1256764.1 4'-phosphopantetheinyl transferase superfamily protein [Alteromonas sp. 5E99-2]